MWFVLNHFRCHIFNSTAEGIPLLHGVACLHTPTEVADFQDAVFTYQEILWLDVSVNQPIFVQEVDP
jgi:hypothetical protein